jgi:hypothetical protein
MNNDERDEFDGPKLSAIEQAIEDCVAAVATELDDGEHDELQAAIRVLIDVAKVSKHQNIKSYDDLQCLARAAASYPTHEECEKETAEYLKSTRGLRKHMTHNQALMHAYDQGMRRVYR